MVTDCYLAGVSAPDYVTEKLPAVAEHLAEAREDILVCTTFPKDVWTHIWSCNTPSGSTARSTAAPTPWVSFPTRVAIMRLVGVVLAEQTDE